MMPTAKKRLGGLGLPFQRGSDGTMNGPGSPRSGLGPVAPALFGTTNASAYKQLQPPLEIIPKRQEIASAARLPMPKNGQYASNYLYTTATQPLTQPLHQLPVMQRLRRANSDRARDARRPRNEPWDDSTVASMFNGSEGRAGSEKHHARQFSQASCHGSQPVNLDRVPDRRRDDSLDPIITTIARDGDTIKLHPLHGAMGPLKTGFSTSITQGQVPRGQSSYQDESHEYRLTPPQVALRHTKLAQREIKKNSLSEQTRHFPAVTTSRQLSPVESSKSRDSVEKYGQQARVERDIPNERVNQVENYRLQEHLRKKREHELQRKRSAMFDDINSIVDRVDFDNTQVAIMTQFENLGPITDPGDFDNTQAAIIARSSDAEDTKDHLLATPRPPRLQQAAVPNRRLKAAEEVIVRPCKHRLEESPKKPQGKRAASPDYDDAALHLMDYSLLRDQAFDDDPETQAMQQAAQATIGPMEGSLADKMEYYQNKDHMARRQLFTQMSLQEWEDAGDWFLEKFGDVFKNFKTARKARRDTVAQFEGEIATREEAVRSKVDGIGRTMRELKQEGLSMMRGKEMDLEH